MRQIKIMIVDDNRDYLNTIAKFLDTKFEIIATATDGMEIIQLLTKDNTLPDIIILDYNMPFSGYETAIWIKTNFPTIKVLVNSMNIQKSIINKFRSLGVEGLISKTNVERTMIPALNRIQGGDTFFEEDSKSPD